MQGRAWVNRLPPWRYEAPSGIRYGMLLLNNMRCTNQHNLATAPVGSTSWCWLPSPCPLEDNKLLTGCNARHRRPRYDLEQQ